LTYENSIIVRYSAVTLCALSLYSCASSPNVLVKTPVDVAARQNIQTGNYTLTPENASIQFSVNTVGVGTVSGQFDEFSSNFTIYSANDGDVTLKATVLVPSISIKNKTFEGIVKSKAWFDIENFQTAEYIGQLMGWQDNGQGLVQGTMTIRDHTQLETFTIQITCDGVLNCPEERIGFEGTLSLNRTDYGMTALGGLVNKTINLSVNGTIDVNR